MRITRTALVLENCQFLTRWLRELARGITETVLRYDRISVDKQDDGANAD